MSQPVRIGLIGAGRIGASHAAVLARRVPEAHLTAVVDPRPGAADLIAGPLGARALSSVGDVLADPAIDAVVISAASVAHRDLIVAAATAGKHVFCEKPAGMSLAEIDEARTAAAAAGVVFQVGFNRRFAADFAAAHDLIAGGRIGEVQLIRSLTRDPGTGPADPGAVPQWTIFTQTLIHDFDTLNWLNPGAHAVDVLATADALIAPDHRDRGHLDTAVVVIRYSNGAIATAEASFAAAYGYDVRGEVFGSNGMVTMGEGATTSMRLHDLAGRAAFTARSDTDLLVDSYTGELTEFCRAVTEKRPAAVTGDDAYAAFAIAQACIDSVTTGARAAVTR
ncbi:Gfo/Idh/MocA family oxidoreductase [Actinoplanes derwentensis]|uniref:Myo-inositol 2-dehydrogenase / D-chiro-inositol 1-dehydrogenase n=2 Tax=Actinoplanes derwentensis TaxID=113562 RepID=A0A1H1V7P3_9ACTN|nr:Gfo/Idh/MocA family oxidoreductase [Actinoplanes derwentensis]GID89256.1 dehydrogenase [Actinoplanes derwentensis]SDS80752.1 myo-inositol 2-dehydrogenase / D-chiro-inositol 1-dehydrogenase [Actinoplanes derwentensis]